MARKKEKDSMLYFCVRDYSEEDAWSVLNGLKHIYVKPTGNGYDDMIREKEFYNLFGWYLRNLLAWYIQSGSWYMKFYKMLDNVYGCPFGDVSDKQEKEVLIYHLGSFINDSFVANDCRPYIPGLHKVRLDIPMDANIVKDIQCSLNYIARRPRYYMCSKRDDIKFYNSGEILLNMTLIRSIMIDIRSGCDGFDELGYEISGFMFFDRNVREARNLLKGKPEFKNANQEITQIDMFTQLDEMNKG